MRFLFGVSCLIILVSCSSSAETNCQAYRTGKFSQKSEVAGGTNLIIRDNETQTEIMGSDTLKSTYKWTDNCNYELTYLPTPSVASQLIGKTIKVRIAKTRSAEVFPPALRSVPFCHKALRSLQLRRQMINPDCFWYLKTTDDHAIELIS